MPLATIFLAGCSDQKIEAVQGKYVDVSRVNTVSNLLNNRHECETIKWSSEKDNKNRDIIRYECVFKNSQDFLKPIRQILIDQKIFFMKSNLEDLEKDLQLFKEKYESEIINEEQSIANAKADLENFLNNKSYENESNDIKDFYLTIVNKLKEIQSNKKAFEFIDFLNSDDFNKYLLNSTYNFTSDAIYNIQKIQSQSYYMNSYPEGERQGYYERNIAKDLGYVYSDIPKLISDFERFSIEDTQKLKTQYDNELSKLEKRIEDTENSKRSERTKETILKLTDKLDTARENYETDFELFKTETFDLLPIFEKGSEQYWWTVNDDLQVNYLGGGVFGYLDNKPIMYYQFFSKDEKFLANTHTQIYETIEDYLYKTNFRVNHYQYPKP